jgi:hypothetical protein
MQVVVFLTIAGLISAAGIWLATRPTCASKSSEANPSPTTTGVEPIGYIAPAEDDAD